MKVSEASNDELNRFIANVLEPEQAIEIQARPTKCWTYCGQGVSYNWLPLDFCASGDGLQMMLASMRKDEMWLKIDSDPNYRDEAHIDVWADAINAHTDWAVALSWGDSNCSHRKNYDPEDGHGYTNLYIIAASLNRAIAEAFALAHGWKE